MYLQHFLSKAKRAKSLIFAHPNKTLNQHKLYLMLNRYTNKFLSQELLGVFPLATAVTFLAKSAGI